MKSLIFILFIFLFVSACGSNSETTKNTETELRQDTLLQRSVMGIKLGETPKDSIVPQMRQMGYKMSQIDRDIFVSDDDVRFGDNIWDFICLVTYDNTVRKIQFVKAVYSEDAFRDNYDRISDVLKDKYQPLVAMEDTSVNKSGIVFMDSLTSLHLQLEIIGETPALTLTYDDSKLETKYNKELYNEL